MRTQPLDGFVELLKAGDFDTKRIPTDQGKVLVVNGLVSAYRGARAKPTKAKSPVTLNKCESKSVYHNSEVPGRPEDDMLNTLRMIYAPFAAELAKRKLTTVDMNHLLTKSIILSAAYNNVGARAKIQHEERSKPTPTTVAVTKPPRKQVELTPKDVLKRYKCPYCRTSMLELALTFSDKPEETFRCPVCSAKLYYGQDDGKPFLSIDVEDLGSEDEEDMGDFDLDEDQIREFSDTCVDYNELKMYDAVVIKLPDQDEPIKGWLTSDPFRYPSGAGGRGSRYQYEVRSHLTFACV